MPSVSFKSAAVFVPKRKPVAGETGDSRFFFFKDPDFAISCIAERLKRAFSMLKKDILQ